MIEFSTWADRSVLAMRRIRLAVGDRRADSGDLAASVVVRLLTLIASMTTLVLSARWLGPEGRGAIATISTWSSMGANIAALSLGQAVVRHAAASRGSLWMGSAMSSMLGYTLVAASATWAVLTIIYFASHGQAISQLPPGQLILGFAIIPLLIWEQYGSALITLAGRIGLYNLAQIVGRVTILALATLFVLRLGWGISGFLGAMLIGQAATALIGVKTLLRLTGRLSAPNPSVMKSLLADGARLHLNTIGVLLFTGTDILMLQYWRGLDEVGIFQLASQLFITTLIVPQSAVLVLNGKIEGLSETAFWQYHKRMLAVVMAVMVAGGAFLALIAKPLIVAFASPAFVGSGDLLRLMLLALPAATLNAMMGIQWITRGYLLRASAITLAAGALNAAANLFLIPRYGANGAALATVVGIYAIPFTSNIALFMFLQKQSGAETLE